MRANDIQHGGEHYKGVEFQHWDLCAKHRIGYLEGVASKYVTRWQKKNGLEDLMKAVHYCDKILEVVDEYNYFATGCASYEDLQRFFDESNIHNRDEQLAITYLLTWQGSNMIKLAKMHVEALVRKAQAQAA